MIYNSKQQLLKFEDELFNTALLGLLELEGRRLMEENEQLKADGLYQEPSTEQIQKIDRMIRNSKRKNRMEKGLRAAVPTVAKAAAGFLVFSLGTSVVFFASADIREALYRLLVSEHERYTQVDPHWEPDSYEQYTAAGANAVPTYVPKAVKFEGIEKTRYSVNGSYLGTEDPSLYLLFRQIFPTDGAEIHLDTEEADTVSSLRIGNSEGMLVVKDNTTQIMWRVEGLILSVSTNLSTEEAIRFAEGVCIL